MNSDQEPEVISPAENGFSPFGAYSPLMFLTLGILAFIVILYCPPYDQTQINNGAVSACTIYSYVSSVPPPLFISGHRLSENQYYFELIIAGALIILTLHGIWCLRQKSGKGEAKGQVRQPEQLWHLWVLWIWLLFGVVWVGVSVCFAPHHAAVWCSGGDGASGTL